MADDVEGKAVPAWVNQEPTSRTTVVGGDGKKKGRKKKDSNAPKHPISAYAFFVRDQHAAVRASEPGINFGQVMKALGNRWIGLGEQEKQLYEDQAVADRIRYKEEKTRYQASSNSTGSRLTAASPAGDIDDNGDQESRFREKAGSSSRNSEFTIVSGPDDEDDDADDGHQDRGFRQDTGSVDRDSEIVSAAIANDVGNDQDGRVLIRQDGIVFERCTIRSISIFQSPRRMRRDLAQE